MSSYLQALQVFLPEAGQWIGLGAAGCVALVFAAVGTVPGSSRELPAVTVLTGWAITAGTLTVVGVYTSLPFSAVWWALGGIAVLSLIWTRGAALAGLKGFLPFVVLGAPLLFIMAGKVPSEVDSFTHWLPNGLYIFEQDGFLRGDRPPSHSAYPGFPYNVTFLFFAVGQVAGQFVENTVILFNVLLLLMFAALLAWLLRWGQPDEPVVNWKLAALGLLLATLLNPVFVRRIWLTSYPDMATSVVVAFAGIAGWLWLQAAAKSEESERARAITFGLLLALLINIKQANLVLVVALIFAMGLVVLRDREIGFSLYLKRLPVFIGLALVLYFTWRYYLVVVTPLHENKMLPFEAWPLERLPDLLRNMGIVVYRKAIYFALAVGLFMWGLRAWFRRPESAFDRLAIMVGAVFVGYNLFLLLIFVAHFNGYPQSYWRFNTHIGYLIAATAVFGAGLLYRDYRSRIGPRVARGLGRVAVGLVIFIPAMETALANYWRFDLEVPKPLLRQAGLSMATKLPPNAAIAVIVPGDFGNFTSIFSHYLAVSRRDVRGVVVNTSAQLDAFLTASEARPAYVWAYCPAQWISDALKVDVAAGKAALLARTGDAWRVERVWEHRPLGGLTRVYKHFDLTKCQGER
jgi:hypothetical protein